MQKENVVFLAMQSYSRELAAQRTEKEKTKRERDEQPDVHQK